MEISSTPTSRRVPASQHIVQIVQERIEKGYYVPGEWLPTERDLAIELKVSRPVIQVAFKHLREQGLVLQQGPGHRSRVSPRTTTPESNGPSVTASRTIVTIMSQSPTLVSGHSILRGINAAMREKEAPYQLVIYDTNNAPTPYSTWEPESSWEKKYLERVEQEGAAGVILFHVAGDETLSTIRAIQQNGVPVVMLDRYSDDLECDFVGTDNRESSKTAVEYLIELGHRRIGYVVQGERPTSVEERLGGYREALEANGIRYNPQLVASGRPNMGAALDHFAGLPSFPTAVAVVNDFAAFELIHEAQARSIRVPEDLSVVGFDDIESYSPRPGMLTTIHQPFYEMGRRAAELILRSHTLSEPAAQRAHRHILLPASLVVRTSCLAPS